MGLDDFADAEVGLAVAATAALTSERVRGVLRRGAVYGLAGVLKAGDAVASAGRGIANGVRREDPTNGAARTTSEPAPRTATPRVARPTRATPRPASPR